MTFAVVGFEIKKVPLYTRAKNWGLNNFDWRPSNFVSVAII